tara:strand:+ start:171 stop:290 length:120 start_codon:yes stop_codon:yes gene_type:complete
VISREDLKVVAVVFCDCRLEASFHSRFFLAVRDWFYFFL